MLKINQPQPATKKYNTNLKPIDNEAKSFELGAFDIEGVGGPQGFIVGGILDQHDYEVFLSPKDMIKYFKTRKDTSKRYFAHNLTYDYSILEPWFDEDDYPLLLNGRVFKVFIHSNKGNTRYLSDSLLLSAGLPLKTVGKIVGLDKLETPEELKHFKPGLSQLELTALLNNKDIFTYLKRDNEVVYQYMSLFQETINHLGGELKFTLASTAMDLFKRKYLTQEFVTPFPSRNDYARHAYYGGRVEAFKFGTSHNVNIYDINSLYPYVMLANVFPNPNHLIGPIENDNPQLIYDYEGISEVIIDIPFTHIPTLPYRTTDKLYFPYGNRRAFYTHVELRYALQHGAKLRQVFSTLYSTETCQPFTNYVTDLYALRQSYKQSNDAREYVVKILLNSLYGKFGQRSEGGLQELRSIIWWLNGNQGVECEFREIDGKVWVLLDKQMNIQADYINTLWASYITSYARLELLKYMLQCGTDIIYADTDSIFTSGTFPTSKELGALKLEYSNVSVEIYGPKAYLILDHEFLLAEKCKGVPSVNQLEFLLTGSTAFNRPTGLLEASRLKPKPDGTPYYPAEWRTVVKEQHTTQPKRHLKSPMLDTRLTYLTVPLSVAQCSD